MTDINTCTLTGRLVREPLVKTGPQGTNYAWFTVASNHRYKSRNGDLQTETAFVPCKAFGGWANALLGCHKGDLVMLTGRFRTENYETDSVHRNQLTLVCGVVHVASRPTRETSSEPEVQANTPQVGDPIPF